MKNGKSAEAGTEFCHLTFEKLISKGLGEGFCSWGRIFKKENGVILGGKCLAFTEEKKKKENNEKYI